MRIHVDQAEDAVAADERRAHGAAHVECRHAAGMDEALVDQRVARDDRRLLPHRGLDDGLAHDDLGVVGVVSRAQGTARVGNERAGVALEQEHESARRRNALHDDGEQVVEQQLQVLDVLERRCPPCREPAGRDCAELGSLPSPSRKSALPLSSAGLDIVTDDFFGCASIETVTFIAGRASAIVECEASTRMPMLAMINSSPGLSALARDAAAVQIGAVGAAQVVDEVLVFFARDPAVEARDRGVIENDQSSRGRDRW